MAVYEDDYKGVVDHKHNLDFKSLTAIDVVLKIA